LRAAHAGLGRKCAAAQPLSQLHNVFLLLCQLKREKSRRDSILKREKRDPEWLPNP